VLKGQEGMNEPRSFPERPGTAPEESETVFDGLEINKLDDVEAVRDDVEIGRSPGSTASTTQAGDVAQKGQEALSTAKGKAAEMTSQATAKAGEGIDKATEMLRQRGEQTGGTVGAAATTAADTLESASSYVRSRDRDQMVQDIESFIRERPVESILIAAGAGFILAKIMS
jgi:ElaB/YqjD/DUF883 family membrane-anchored ribosome-binding protein